MRVDGEIAEPLGTLIDTKVVVDMQGVVGLLREQNRILGLILERLQAQPTFQVDSSGHVIAQVLKDPS